MINIGFKGVDEFERAIARNPEIVIREGKRYLTRASAKVRSVIMNNPWRIGSDGGGSPVKTGALLRSHTTKIETFKAIIKPSAFYAIFVHEGTFAMQPRPWLDYAKEKSSGEIEKLQVELLETVVKELAK